jgi:alkanesulfonate monooxygenase SsuD/methylene tetrahydromethanopterin reductase-like flavin-dependent oxidoreductase (luciferase family)
VTALHAHCRTVGREPAAVEVSHLSTILVGRDRDEVGDLVERLRPRRVAADRFAAHVNAGTVDDHVHRIERLATAGVTTFVVRLADVAEPGALERLGRLVERTGAARPIDVTNVT